MTELHTPPLTAQQGLAPKKFKFKQLSRLDSQIQEIYARNILVNKLLENEFEIALPVRDCGIDLLVYKRNDSDTFKKVQLKSGIGNFFSFQESYLKIDGLLTVYVMDVLSPAYKIYGMTTADILNLMKKSNINFTARNKFYRRDIPKAIRPDFEKFDIRNNVKFSEFFDLPN